MATAISIVALIVSIGSAFISYRSYRDAGWRVTLGEPMVVKSSTVQVRFTMHNVGRHDVQVAGAYFADKAQEFAFIVSPTTELPLTLTAGHAVGLVFEYNTDPDDSEEFIGYAYIRLGDGKWQWRLCPSPLPVPYPRSFHPGNEFSDVALHDEAGDQ